MPPVKRTTAVPPERRSTSRRIVLVAHALSQGGTDRVAAILADAYAGAGFDVTLVLFCSGGNAEQDLLALIGPGARIIHLGGPSRGRTLDLLTRLPALVRRLRAIRPVALISTANNTAWIGAAALWLARARQCRLILKTTNPIAQSRHGRWRGMLRDLGYAAVFRRTAAVWTLSDAETAQMRAAFPATAGRIRTIINPYVTPAMLMPHDARRSGAPAKLIAIGRLTAQKRFDLLIAGFARIADRSARLTILGEGRDRPALERLIAALGLGDRISLPGFVSDVAGRLRTADLLVMTSIYEGLPAAVLEAMAANLPVLTTDCFPAARALIGCAPGCAIIEPADPATVAARIDDALLRPRPTALSALAERYSIARGAADHVAALEALIKS